MAREELKRVMESKDSAIEQKKKEEKLTLEERETLRRVIDVINRLIVACKSITLYPLKHPIAENALGVLYTVLTNFLQEHGVLTLAFSMDNIIYKDFVLGHKLETFRNFAYSMRNHKIRELTILPGIDPIELEQFVRLLISDPEDVELEGGFETQLFVMSISHVSVLESLSREKPEEPEDMEGEEDKDQAVDLFALLEEAVKGFADRVQELVNLMLKPENLAYSLVNIHRRKKTVTDKSQVVEGIFLFLKRAARFVGNHYPNNKSPYYRSLAEALLFLDTDLRNLLFINHILPQLGEEPFCVELLSQFTAYEISAIFSYLLPEVPELIPRTPEYLRMMGLSEDEVDQALEALREKLLERGEIPDELLDTLETAFTASGEAETQRKLPTLEEVAEFFKEYSEEDIRQISAISEMNTERERLVESTPVMLNLFRRGEKIDNLPQVVNELVENFWGLLEHNEMGQAALILEEFKTRLGMLDPVYAPFRDQMVMLVNEAANHITMSGIIRMACSSWSDPVVQRDFETYLQVLGEAGINALVNVLGSEEDMNLRKFILDTLVKHGRNFVHLLGSRIKDHRWYLVRNVVSVLGRFRSREVLPYLRETFYHPNPRVRAETIRALGCMGFFEATDILLEGLNNPDYQTRMLCIRWLGRLEEKRATVHLINLLGQLKEKSLEDLRLKKEAIIALGKIGNLDALPILEKYKTMKRLTYRGEWEEINRVAEEACRHIEEIFSHTRRGEDGRGKNVF